MTESEGQDLQRMGLDGHRIAAEALAENRRPVPSTIHSGRINRMSIKRLSNGQVQIYLDEQGTALFSDVVQKRDRAAVETALAKYRDFIDRWLEASEEKRPRHATEEEREFRATLKRFGQGLVRTRLFETEFVKKTIREVAKHIAQQSPNLSARQNLGER